MEINTICSGSLIDRHTICCVLSFYIIIYRRKVNGKKKMGRDMEQ